MLGSVPKKCIPKNTSFDTHVNLIHQLFFHQKPSLQNPRHIQQSSPLINRLLPNKISPKNKHITTSHPPSSKTTSNAFQIFVGFVPKPLPKPTNSHELLGFFVSEKWLEKVALIRHGTRERWVHDTGGQAQRCTKWAPTSYICRVITNPRYPFIRPFVRMINIKTILRAKRLGVWIVGCDLASRLALISTRLANYCVFLHHKSSIKSWTLKPCHWIKS